MLLYFLSKKNCTCSVQIHGDLCDQVKLECTKHAVCCINAQTNLHIESATVVFSQASKGLHPEYTDSKLQAFT